VIIANPPYKSYGLRGVDALSSEEKEIMKKNYPNSAEYKISFYAIFMDLALKLANNLGTNILIVPDSFLLGMYFSKIRIRVSMDRCNRFVFNISK
jgi:adenine-specific DNA methylase